jgi:hypothetical protein
MPWHESKGILRKDPRRKNIKFLPWWLIIEADPELGRYYLQMTNWEYRSHFQLQKPAWGPHVTIVRGEEPPNIGFWNALTSVEVGFLL